MRVLSVAYPLAKVRPDTPGGAEQILLALDRALVRAGHESFVIAQKNSKIRGRLLAIPDLKGRIDNDAAVLMRGACRAAVRNAIKKLKIDIVHMHGLDFHEYMPPEGAPVLVTLHLPLAWYQPGALKTRRPCTFFNCVSGSQARSLPEAAGHLEHIDNGVDTDAWEQLPKQQGQSGYALSMGRICPEKGFHVAMDAASGARVPFILAGAVFRYGAHEEYFQKMIAPRLSKYCRFAGVANPERKKRLLYGARCLVVPSLVAETSSLVAMEALASGTPVVAFPNGALAEIVEDGLTGFLVKDENEMSLAIRECPGLSPEACRKAAAKRFSSAAMIEKYFETYGKIAACKAQMNGSHRH
ncbi:MAG: glycosyltransferase [Deltaproteobacteria bacterium]|nr:glycosyltransferase [Deltaproteobacteria bacterium]